MAAMILAVTVVSFASYELVRGQVRSHFDAALQMQYAKQFDLFQTRKIQRLDSISNEIITNTSNPRLMAALFEDDFSRFYYDLAQELKPFYQNLEAKHSDSSTWPFFRFIKSDGQYLAPPNVLEVGIEQAVDSLPGILSPIPEEELRKLLSGLQTTDADTLETRSGYLVYRGGKTSDASVLFEAFVCPVMDPFGGFLGDLIVVIPWRGDEIGQANIVSTIVIGSEVFTPEKALFEPKAWSRLVEFLSNPEVLDDTTTILVGNTNYAVLSKQLIFDPRFPVAHLATLFSLAEQEALNQSIANVLLLIVAGGLTFSIVLSYLIAHGLNAPITRLREGVIKIGQGDFTVRVAKTSEDEVGQLTESFNQMAADLSTKERYKHVLSQVTDSGVADKMINGEFELGGTELEVAILFCDIRGFTHFSSTVDPHELVTILNEHMTLMTEIAYKYGGVVDKFVGDEIMILFGAPVESSEDIPNAFHAAREMITRRAELNAQSKHAIRIGIGIAYGPVVAGCMGSEDRLNYTVIGERVNLAARLCSEAAPMEIAIDSKIHAHLGIVVEGAEKRIKALKGIASTEFYIINE